MLLGIVAVNLNNTLTRKHSPLPDDGGSDIEGYNKEIEQRGNPTWFNVTWLFSECYMYRRIATIFRLSKHWKNHDVFFKQKQSTFRSSRAGVIELAFHYNEVLKNLRSPDSALAQLSEEERTKAEEALFVEMGEICLWGNATDLSLLMHLSLEEVQKLQGAESRKANQDKIIANDFPAAFKVLKDAQRSGKKDRRVDIVLDNAGFELFVDLVLAGYLLESGLATHVILHPKNIPWFVSDVVPRDFADTLNVLQNAKAFYETPGDEERAKGTEPVALSKEEEKATDGVFAHWSELYAEGKITLRPNDFWTHAGSYWRMPATAPKLIEDLKESELVIFKGDLNYRKLTGDVSCAIFFPPHLPLPLTILRKKIVTDMIFPFLQAHWDPTTPFPSAIGPLGPGSGLRILSFRTVKADVVVGLPKGKDEELRAMEGGGGDSGARKWAWGGRWAVVSLSDGKQ